MLRRHGSINLSLSAAARTMREFDDATIAPMMGTAGADEYYAQASSSALLAGLAVPTLFLSAANDPICPAQVVRDIMLDALPSEPPILLAITPEGGHSMVWPTGVRADGAWSIEVLCEWVSALCQEQETIAHPAATAAPAPAHAKCTAAAMVA
jgi:predicted alpha/beta-fold hydrolase